MEIGTRLDHFKSDVKSQTARFVVRKHIIYGDCYAINNDKYFLLRSEISEQFGVHPNEVFVVGSAKLGFSIAPHKLFRHFGNESDIDIAIISTELFSRIWADVHAFQADGGFWEKKEKFSQYLFDGWIRPDCLPPATRFAYCKEWWKFFEKLSNNGKYGPYKIAAGIYHSWYFFEAYSSRAVNICMRRLEV